MWFWRGVVLGEDGGGDVPRMGPKRAPIAQRLMARPLSSGRIRSATVPLHWMSVLGGAQ